LVEKHRAPFFSLFDQRLGQKAVSNQECSHNCCDSLLQLRYYRVEAGIVIRREVRNFGEILKNIYFAGHSFGLSNFNSMIISVKPKPKQ